MRGAMRGVMRDKIITHRSLHGPIRRDNFLSRTPNMGEGDYYSDVKAGYSRHEHVLCRGGIIIVTSGSGKLRREQTVLCRTDFVIAVT